MFKFQLLSAGLLLGLTAAVPASVCAEELRDLKVLYVGSERASAYVGFLSGKVARIEARSRHRLTSSCSTGRRGKKPAKCESSSRRSAGAKNGRSRPCYWEARGSTWLSHGN
jgi:hypothetical protein